MISNRRNDSRQVARVDPECFLKRRPSEAELVTMLIGRRHSMARRQHATLLLVRY